MLVQTVDRYNDVTLSCLRKTGASGGVRKISVHEALNNVAFKRRRLTNKRWIFFSRYPTVIVNFRSNENLRPLSTHRSPIQLTMIPRYATRSSRVSLSVWRYRLEPCGHSTLVKCKFAPRECRETRVSGGVREISAGLPTMLFLFDE